MNARTNKEKIYQHFSYAPIALTTLPAYTGRVDSEKTKLIEDRLGEIKKLIGDLQREEDELGITLRVLKRFSPNNTGDSIATKLGPPRPPTAPTTFEMTNNVLMEAEMEGKDGLFMAEIIAGIGNRFWPGLVAAQIAPSIYQFATQGRLHKTPSGKFKRIKTNEKGPES